MNSDWTTDLEEIDEVLAQLSRAQPDAARSNRVRASCHKKLARPRSLPRRSRDRRERVAKAGALESAVVGGFCAVYLTLLMLIALRTHGLL